MSNLVSIIIPCFNAEKWIAEAIDSCLKQSHKSIQVIVINDGSTDRSLEIIKSYGEKITFESGPNKGGNYARNRGLTLSKGKYIQFLDADDYILENKIKRQVAFLEATSADIVYGDWRYQRHLPDSSILLEDVQIANEQQDILESLLANWWVALASLLFRKEIIDQISGWNENLKVGQDRDFFLSLVMNNAKVVYQPGCYSIYRTYGNLTVSTSSKSTYLKSHLLIIETAENKLLQKGKLSIKYKQALSQSYFQLARDYLEINKPEIYLRLLEKTIELHPHFRANIFRINNNYSNGYRIAQNILGFQKTERLFKLLKYVKSFFKLYLYSSRHIS